MLQRDNPLIASKYKSKKWQRLRNMYMSSVHGLCERCSKNEIKKPAEILHHIIYIDETNYMLNEVFYNILNLEALCRDCHNKEHFTKEDDYKFDEDGELIYCE